VGETPKEFLEVVRPYFVHYANEVKKHFDGKSSLPPRSAYFNSKRSEGGCLNYFNQNKLITTNVWEQRSNSDRRIDPIMIHLAGKPGMGKSYLVNSIAHELSKKFGYKLSDKYERSIATDHWDGYRGQLVSVIDDIFANPDGTIDQLQLLQVCSNVECVLPMADLKEKGTKFSSDFLIITSNYLERSFTTQGKCVNNKDAVMRRIFPLIEIMNRQGSIYTIRYQTYNLNDNIIEKGKIFEIESKDLIKKIVEESIKIHRQRRENTDFVVKVQAEGPFGLPALGYKIPINPPEELPKVITYAIPEPLKVRIITKGEENVWVLKPVQKAMWKALAAYPCFKLTSTPNIPIEWMNTWDQKKLCLSGDYESATDNLNMDVTRLMIECLKEVIPSPFKEWMEWEGGIHEIHYPPSTGIKPFLQTRGQLMGSLLSFPILCMINASILASLQGVPLKELEANINGDDIFFLEDRNFINKWKRVVAQYGLIPSIGKNYCAENWGSINSQLLKRDKNGFKVAATGNFGAISKITTYKLLFATALRIEPQSKSYFIKKAKKMLVQTPQSVDIPTEYGGLGVGFHKKPELRDRQIYFFNLYNKKIRKIREIDDDEYWEVPKHLYMKYKGLLGSQSCIIPDPYLTEDDLAKPSELRIFEYNKFKKFCKFYKTVPNLRDRINKSNLEHEVPLNLLKTINIKVAKSYSRLIENMRNQL